MLAKHLIGQLSASDDYEESMISKLKVNISFQRAILFAIIFSDKIVPINLNVPLNLLKQKEIEDVHQTMDEGRKMVILTAII
ncbi:unnamed protein product [Rotaria sp. Silwood1]|nr:unnamed protein product [Rotaria sp. Silwood1]